MHFLDGGGLGALCRCSVGVLGRCALSSVLMNLNSSTVFR